MKTLNDIFAPILIGSYGINTDLFSSSSYEIILDGNSILYAFIHIKLFCNRYNTTIDVLILEELLSSF
jgi:hypothetical protein